MRRILLPAAALCMLSPAALPADVVTLRNGMTLEGIVRRDGGGVRVELEFGAITVEEARIERIEPGTSPLEDYRRRAASVPEGDAPAHARLAAWCLTQNLQASAREQYERVVALDPDHAEARRRLGYRRHDRVWMTEEEVWSARGYVRHEGRWMTQAEAAGLEEANRREAQDRAQAELEAARLRLAAMELEVARAQAEAARREEDRRAWGAAPSVLWRVGRRSCRATGFETAPAWCAPSWQNPEPICEAGRGAEEPASSPWQIRPGPVWHTPASGWGASEGK